MMKIFWKIFLKRPLQKKRGWGHFKMGQKISGKNFTRLTVGCFKGGFKVGGTEWGVTGVVPP